ncbi:MAG: T9SS type A sorting domain-containing protein [bacterium]
MAGKKNIIRIKGFLFLGLVLILTGFQPVQGAVTILEDFEDGDTLNPYLWVVIKTDSCSASFTADSGSGYGSVYAGHGTYTIVVRRHWCVFAGFYFNGSFQGDGIVFYARGNGIWDINLIISEINPLTDPLPFVRVTLDSIWRAYYIPWNEFSYPPRAVTRPEINPGHIQALFIAPQSRQAGRNENFYIDNIGYFTADSISPQDVDGDGIPNEIDWDADNDGWFNILEAYAGTDSLDTGSYPQSRLYFPVSGTYTGIFPLQYWSDEFYDFESITSLKSALAAVFVPGWGDTTTFYHFDRGNCDFIARYGAIPVYQWPILNARRSNSYGAILDTLFRLKDIIEGRFDAQLADFATEIRNWKKPIILNPAVEYNQGWTSYHGLSNFGADGKHMPPRSLLGAMDTTWIVDSLLQYCDTVPAESISNYYGDPNVPDGPERLKDALLHIKNVFENVGATNVIWTMQTHPIVNGAHFGNWSNLSNYYTDEYVDCHSISAHHGVINDTPRTLSKVISECYDTLIALNPAKPIIVIEFAVHSDSTGSMDMTNTFVNDFTVYFPDSFPMIKGWTYANSDRYDSDYVHTGLQIDSSRYIGEINAFRAVASNPYYIKIPILLPVGIEEKTRAKIIGYVPEVEIFPNPSHRNIIFRVNATGLFNNESIHLDIYDITGRSVKSFYLKSNNQSARLVWDCRDNNNKFVPSGVYFVRLARENGFSETRKFVIIH